MEAWSECIGMKTLASFMRACGFGEGSSLLCIDTVKCTIFHACLTYRTACVECLRRKMWPNFSLVKLVGILEPKLNAPHVEFSFCIDWEIAVVHAPPLMLWLRSNHINVEP